MDPYNSNGGRGRRRAGFLDGAVEEEEPVVEDHVWKNNSWLKMSLAYNVHFISAFFTVPVSKVQRRGGDWG